MGGGMSLLAERKIGTEELVLFWRQFNGSPEKGVAIVSVKKMLAALCEKKQVVYSEEECDKVIHKLCGNNVPAELNFDQFRVFFATALSRKDFDLSESLAVDSLAMSTNN